MTTKQIAKLSLAITLLYGISLDIFAEITANPCGGATALLNLIDRPTVGDSACVVPFKQGLIELGYQYQDLTHSAGNQQNFPEAELRIGLPLRNEFVILLPNYIHQSMSPHSGSSATVIGLKHEIGYNEKWVTAAETLLTLPDGSAAFGSKGMGAAFNGIVSYDINAAFNLTFMFGGTTETESSQSGGQRFTSFNPDIVLTYAATDKLQLYGEAYGQSKTGPGEGSGFNCDAGFLYLFIPNMEVDFEIGRRISGSLGGFNQYIGTGMGILF